MVTRSSVRKLGIVTYSVLYKHQEARLWQQAIKEYLGTSSEEKISADIFLSSVKKVSDISTLIYDVKELVSFEGQHHQVQHILRRLWKDLNIK